MKRPSIVGVQNSGPDRHLRRALANRLDDVVGILRRGREAGVLEVVDAGREAAADLLGPMRVRDDRQVALVRLVDDGLHFVQRHLILIDQLDDVDAGVGELLHLGARVGDAVHAPAEQLGARIRRVLDERARHVQRRARESRRC